MTTTKITVTSDHIARGIKGSAGNCPIALAITDAAGFKAYVAPKAGRYDNGWYVVNDNGGEYSDLPKNAGDFARAFDDGKDVEPFCLELDLPDDVCVVNVTQEHINNGWKGASRSCPIAKAINESYNIQVSVYGSHVRKIGTSDYRDLPQEARDFIVAFDINGPGHVKPFSFKMTRP